MGSVLTCEAYILYSNLKVRLLSCVSICGSIVSANQFSSRVVRGFLLCGSVSVGHVFVLALTCRLNPVVVENADAR